MYISFFLSEFVKLYNLGNIVDNEGFLLIEIRGSIYRLPQARRLVQGELVTHLALCSYSSVKFTPSLWTHNMLKTTFTLAVDDFGIKYLSMKDVQHLKQALKNIL